MVTYKNKNYIRLRYMTSTMRTGVIPMRAYRDRTTAMVPTGCEYLGL